MPKFISLKLRVSEEIGSRPIYEPWYVNVDQITMYRKVGDGFGEARMSSGKTFILDEDSFKELHRVFAQSRGE